MTFWDSSALVPLLVEEPRSGEARQLLGKDAMSVSWFARIEMASAVSRLTKSGSLDEQSGQRNSQVIEMLAAAWIEIHPQEEIRRMAIRMLHGHGLRTLDALQLASAWLASEGRPDTLDFICFDARLAAAAQREGFRVRS